MLLLKKKKIIIIKKKTIYITVIYENRDFVMVSSISFLFSKYKEKATFAKIFSGYLFYTAMRHVFQK